MVCRQGGVSRVVQMSEMKVDIGGRIRDASGDYMITVTYPGGTKLQIRLPNEVDLKRTRLPLETKLL